MHFIIERGHFQDPILQSPTWQNDFLTLQYLSLQYEISPGDAFHILGQVRDLRAKEPTEGAD